MSDYKTEFKLSILDEAKMALRGKVEGSTGQATLKVSVLNNQPRVTVFTGVVGDPNKGCIIARMDGPTFATFLTTALQSLEDPEFKKFGVYNHGHPKGDDGKLNTKELKVDSLLQMAKDPDGRYFISVTDKQVTPVKFYFEPTQYHKFVKDGNELDKVELSKHYAKAWLSLIFKLMPMVLHSQYEPYRPQNNNGNSYGGNKSFNKPKEPLEAPSSSASDAFDDDIGWD